jgi:hypothetical protein
MQHSMTESQKELVSLRENWEIMIWFKDLIDINVNLPRSYATHNPPRDHWPIFKPHECHSQGAYTVHAWQTHDNQYYTITAKTIHEGAYTVHAWQTHDNLY